MGRAAATARRLGISETMVRRHIRTLEEVHGTLPRDSQGRRFYDDKVTDQLSDALDAVRSGAVASVREALEGTLNGTTLTKPVGRSVGEGRVGLVLQHLESLTTQIQTLTQEVSDLKSQVSSEVSDLKSQVSSEVSDLKSQVSNQPDWADPGQRITSYNTEIKRRMLNEIKCKLQNLKSLIPSSVSLMQSLRQFLNRANTP
jgi:DNA-binding transcriptional MerR regulator